MAQLLRDNAADARVIDDVSTLVAAYDEAGVAEAAEARVRQREADLALVAELFARSDEPTDPWPQRVRTHLARHRTYYAVGVFLLAVVLFRSPEPLPLASGDDGANFVIPTADASGVDEAAETSESVAPYADPFPFASSPFDFPLVVAPPSAAAPAENDAPASAPTPLRFVATGYASTLGGTPVDQAPPGNGLPVEMVAGQVTKYSYARLTGEDTTLRLRPVTDEGAELNPAQARIQLCQITAAWTPSRATPTRDAPPYGDTCIEGTAKNGVWSFVFSSITNPRAANGWAIVPVLDGNATYRVTFAGAPV